MDMDQDMDEEDSDEEYFDAPSGPDEKLNNSFKWKSFSKYFKRSID